MLVYLHIGDRLTLAAAHVDFTSHGMLDGPGLPAHLFSESQDQAHPDLDSMPTVQDKEHDVDAIDGPRSLSEVTLAKSPIHNVPRSFEGLVYHINQPRLPELTQRLLYDQLHPDAPEGGDAIDLNECPSIIGKVQ